MDACLAVEREIDKVLTKFADIDRHATSTLQELLAYVQGIKQELHEGMYSTSMFGRSEVSLGHHPTRPGKHAGL